MNGQRRLSLSQLTTELIVGLVFIAALLVLGFFTIILSRNTFFGKRKQLRQVDFPQIGALTKGDKVLLRGVPVGQVGGVALSPANPSLVRVTLSFDHTLIFGENYVAEIRSSSVLGGEYVYLELGDVTKPVAGVLTGKPPADVFGEAKRLADNLNDVVLDVREFSAKLRNNKSTLARLVSDDSLHRSAEEALGAVKQAGDQLRTEITGVRTTLDQTAAGVEEAVGSVKATADSLNRNAERLGRTADNLDGLISDARAGRGTVGRLLTDEQLYNELTAAATEVRKVAASLGGQQSSFGRVLHDNGALYDSLKTAFDNAGRTLGDAAAVVAQVKKGEGSLGKVIYDETLYRELLQAVRDLGGAVSDYREQAPILSLGSFIFGSL